MKKDSIGMLDRRVDLMKPTTSNNAINEEVLTFVKKACVWAKVEYSQTASGEIYMGDQHTVRQRVIFTMRWRDDITEKWLIRWQSVDYDIENIEQIGRNEYIKVITEKRV